MIDGAGIRMVGERAARLGYVRHLLLRLLELLLLLPVQLLLFLQHHIVLLVLVLRRLVRVLVAADAWRCQARMLRLSVAVRCGRDRGLPIERRLNGCRLERLRRLEELRLCLLRLLLGQLLWRRRHHQRVQLLQLQLMEQLQLLELLQPQLLLVLVLLLLRRRWH